MSIKIGTPLNQSAKKVLLCGAGELGKEVAIEGKLTTRSWDDKEGVKRYTTEVVCNEILMLGNK